MADFTDHVAESQVSYSTALHATLDGGRHLTGPLARFSLNSAALSPIAAQAAAAAGLLSECRNPFRSIIVRAVEVVYAIEESLRIIEEYERPPRPFVDVPARAGVGHGVSEAPRGLLYHRYRIDTDGLVSAATIIPPTSQNQGAIEADLARLVSDNLSLDDAALTGLCRAIDPQPRPLHLMFSTLLDADGRPKVICTDGEIVVIGLGNTYRADDGVGVVVAAALDELALPGVRVVTDIAEPMNLLEAWSGAGLAVVIDAAVVSSSVPSEPGRIRRCALSDIAASSDGLSSHSVDIGRTHALGQALRRVPDALVVFTVEVADTRHGTGLTPQVARAVPEVVGMVVSEITRGRTTIGA